MKKFRNIFNIVLIAALSFTIISCEDIWNRCVDGNGDRGLENRDLADFNRIEINGDFDVQIDTGSESLVVIETDDNLIDLIVTPISGNKLIIETRYGTCIRPTHRVQIKVTARSLSEITLNGSGLVYCYGLSTNNLELNLSGSGEIECNNMNAVATTIDLAGSGLIDCDIETENIISQLEGSGQIKLRGECISSDHKIIGSGTINASLLNAKTSVVYISGSGVADVDVNEALDVTIIGSGKVYYTGNPTVEEYISGSGDVIER